MRPIPIVFHIGPLAIHTYGIGLAITFWFAYSYFMRRLRANGYQTEWFAKAFVWIIVSSIVGARVVHVIANWRTIYEHNPGQIIQIWQGGLSSFGGLGFGIAAGIITFRRYYPAMRIAVALDLVAPVLMASWGLGRLLGPQMMINGGGHPTDRWFGMSYACTPGLTGCNINGFSVKELPAPIFQSIESFAVFGMLIIIERWVNRRGGPTGMVIAGLFAFWGIARFIDELLWLDVNPPPDAVEVTGLVMCAGGFIAMAILAWRFSNRSPIRIEDDIPVESPADDSIEDESGAGGSTDDEDTQSTDDRESVGAGDSQAAAAEASDSSIDE